jgi:hypothetical protein
MRPPAATRSQSREMLSDRLGRAGTVEAKPRSSRATIREERAQWRQAGHRRLELRSRHRAPGRLGEDRKRRTKIHSGRTVTEIFKSMLKHRAYDVAELGLTYFLRTFEVDDPPSRFSRCARSAIPRSTSTRRVASNGRRTSTTGPLGTAPDHRRHLRPQNLWIREPIKVGRENMQVSLYCGRARLHPMGGEEKGSTGP